MVLPRKNNEVDLAENLLDKLARHPDETTRKLSEWALDNRLGENGSVRPLIDASV